MGCLCCVSGRLKSYNTISPRAVNMTKLAGQLKVPGDKSITHRALIFSALAKGRCELRGSSPAGDCLNTARCLQRLGISFEPTLDGDSLPSNIEIISPGLDNMRGPSSILDAGNSGT